MITTIRQAIQFGQEFGFSNGQIVLEVMLLAVAFLIAILMALTVHEFAHGFMAYKCGDMTAKYSGRMSLNPARHFDPIGFFMLLLVGFGWAKPVPINPNNFTKSYKKSMVLVSIAGVTANLILVFLMYPLFLVCSRFMPYGTEAAFFAREFFTYFFMVFCSINLSLAVFNLLPVYPLDGFNLMDTLAKPYNRFVEFMRRYGTFVLIGLLIVMNIPIIQGDTIFGWLVDKIGWPIYTFWEWIFSLGGGAA